MSTSQNEFILDQQLNAILASGRVTDQDVLSLRRSIFGDGYVSPAEADKIFAVNELADKADSWFDLFVEGMTDFLVRQTMPKGYINTANAMWLMARIDHDGVVETRSELELLLHVMRIADNVTDELETYALNQVKHAVLSGRGYLGKSRSAPIGTMSAADVDMLRRVLYAVSSQNGVGISKMEAETLFEINDALEGEYHDPAWQQLFVGAVASHLMRSMPAEEPDAQEALRREAFLESRSENFVLPTFNKEQVAAVIKSMFASDNEAILLAAHERDCERINHSEAKWLIERLTRDGQLSPNESALLHFLERESPAIHSALLPFIKAA